MRTFHVSDRAGAAIASAVSKDFGIVDDNDMAKVIDRNKLRRERQKCREKVGKEEENNFQVVNAIYVDGRKDATLTTSETDNSKFHPKVEIKEHYVVGGEPGEVYLTHLNVEDGKGITIAEAIHKALKNTELQRNLSIMGSDGIAVMTGKHHGSIATLEKLLQRPLQWVICVLHINELPLTHAFKHLDGVTASPDSFSGPIGKKHNGLISDWKVTQFNPISSSEFPLLPKEVSDQLSSDQFYAYQICMAVISGRVDNDFAQLEVGGMSHFEILCFSNFTKHKSCNFGRILHESVFSELV